MVISYSSPASLDPDDLLGLAFFLVHIILLAKVLHTYGCCTCRLADNFEVTGTDCYCFHIYYDQ